MRPPDSIRTERLLIRGPKLSDATAIFENYATDPDVLKYLTWKPHSTVEETKAMVPVFMKAWDGSSTFPWVITRRPDDEAVGMIEARIEDGEVELGYVLAHRYWGEGLMTEAVKAVVNWGLAHDSIGRVWAYADVDNAGSARVLEKAGMTRERRRNDFAHHPNTDEDRRDVWLYGINTIHGDVRELEESMWRPETRGNRQWIDHYLAADFIEFGCSGRRYSRSEVVDAPIGEIDAQLPLADLSIRPLGDGHVLVTYQSLVSGARCHRSSIWRRTENDWVMEFHQGTLVPDT